MAMLRTLLADRFGLAFHREMRPLPAYVLTVGKNGLKIQPSKDGDPRPLPGSGKLALRVTLKQFAGIVTQYLKMPFPGSGEVLAPHEALPVIDETGLTGTYDIVVNLKINGDWFDAVDSQLGFKLEARKTPLGVFAIDSAVRPAEN
jgi:uncharacterized protein (TIGR03435 family)